jgi:hypothetical protein
MRRAVRLIAIFALPLLTACGKSPSELVGGRYLRSFIANPSDTMLQDSVSHSTDFATILLQGQFESSTGCVSLDARLEDNDKELELTVYTVGQQNPCTAALGYFRYNVIIGYIQPASYHLRVHHKDARGTRTVFDRTVVVSN